jgi:hypothetical protein
MARECRRRPIARRDASPAPGPPRDHPWDWCSQPKVRASDSASRPTARRGGARDSPAGGCVRVGSVGDAVTRTFAPPGRCGSAQRASRGARRSSISGVWWTFARTLASHRSGAARSLFVRCGSRLDESALVGDDDELGAAACVEFEKDAADAWVFAVARLMRRCSAVSSLVSASATSSGSGRRVASW